MADDASAVGAGTGHSDRAVVGTDPTAARANPHLAADEVVPRGHGDRGVCPGVATRLISRSACTGWWRTARS